MLRTQPYSDLYELGLNVANQDKQSGIRYSNGEIQIYNGTAWENYTGTNITTGAILQQIKNGEAVNITPYISSKSFSCSFSDSAENEKSIGSFIVNTISLPSGNYTMNINVSASGYATSIYKLKARWEGVESNFITFSKTPYSLEINKQNLVTTGPVSIIVLCDYSHYKGSGNVTINSVVIQKK